MYNIRKRGQWPKEEYYVYQDGDTDPISIKKTLSDAIEFVHYMNGGFTVNQLADIMQRLEDFLIKLHDMRVKGYTFGD